MNNRTQASELLELLDIQFDEVSSTRVIGSVAADQRHHQPWGIVHGGLYTAVIETFATTGAFEAVKDRDQQAVGISNATDFLRPHRTGRLQVLAIPIQQGRTQQLWQVEIRRLEDDKLIARGQVRLQNIEATRNHDMGENFYRRLRTVAPGRSPAAGMDARLRGQDRGWLRREVHRRRGA